MLVLTRPNKVSVALTPSEPQVISRTQTNVSTDQPQTNNLIAPDKHTNSLHTHIHIHKQEGSNSTLANIAKQPNNEDAAILDSIEVAEFSESNNTCSETLGVSTDEDGLYEINI